MEQQEKSNKMQKMTNHQINMEVMKFPNYYQSLARTMLLQGESVEQVQSEIDKFSHMY